MWGAQSHGEPQGYPSGGCSWKPNPSSLGDVGVWGRPARLVSPTGDTVCLSLGRVWGEEGEPSVRGGVSETSWRRCQAEICKLSRCEGWGRAS